MTDPVPLNYFLGISATRTTSGIFLSLTKYATDILERAQMLNYDPCRTPVDTEKKLGPKGSSVTDPTLYHNLVGALQYLTFTRPDLSYAVQQLCPYMHDPREPHLNAMKCVLRDLRGTTDLGLQLFWSTTSQLIAYSDADWDTLSRSSAEAEYRGAANAVAETTWICNLLRELHTPLFTATLVYCDNVSVIYMSANPLQHQRTKHIEIDIHFVRDKVAADPVPLNYFLGISATRTTSGIFLSLKKYATDILERAQMLNCDPCRTPVDTEKKLGPKGSSVTDPTLYRSLAGALQYLTFTRPDLSYAVQQLCPYMHDPREPHLNAMKCVLRYLRGTPDLGLQLFCAIYMSANPLQHQRTKHIEIDIHFVRDKVAA
nr:ribonuclease H-like domain-containing protein [Tanacetum cinerariifolium]